MPAVSPVDRRCEYVKMARNENKNMRGNICGTVQTRLAGKKDMTRILLIIAP
jgi:hypothetical protein